MKKEKINQEKKYNYVLDCVKEYARETGYAFMSYNLPKMMCVSDGKSIVRINEFLEIEGHAKLCPEIAGLCQFSLSKYKKEG